MRQGSDDGPIAIAYKRGPLLYLPGFVLGASIVFTLAFIVLVFGALSTDERALAWGLSAILVAVTAVVVVATVPPIQRFGSSAPAIVVSSEGIETRDMNAILPWSEIDKLTTASVHAWAGRHTTVTNVLEIHPRSRRSRSGGWRWLVDGHANELRVAWHVLADPEKLGEALARHAPPAIWARSDLTELPGVERQSTSALRS